jgi:hypothetical protein
MREYMYASVESKVEEKARWEAIGNNVELECGCPFCYCPNMVTGADICSSCVEKNHVKQFSEYMAKMEKIEAQRYSHYDY